MTATQSRTRSALAILGPVLVVCGLVSVVIRERDTFDAALTQISLGEPAHFVASLALVTIGYGLLPTIAWATASNEVAKVPALPAAVAWLGAGVTKYVPGLIWHPVSAVERMQRRDRKSVV